MVLHHRFQQNAYSTNWSGYAVTGASGSVNDVKGSWTVPDIASSCPSTNQYASFWVGIDGFSSNTVEQIGTDSDCQNGSPTYYAWFEFYPHPAFVINSVTIHPGDKIFAEVSYAIRQFTVSLRDETTGQSFSGSSRVNRAIRSSGEWIAEAPYSSGGLLPLADFGTAYYGYDLTGVIGTCEANGVAIGSFPTANVNEITMVSQSNSSVKAAPSSLSADGSSFSDKWESAGP
jgi:hypothetical protein